MGKPKNISKIDRDAKKAAQRHAKAAKRKAKYAPRQKADASSSAEPRQN